MSAFAVHDAWGLAGGALVLIFIYLILREGGSPFVSVVKAGGDATGSLIRSLQGRY